MQHKKETINPPPMRGSYPYLEALKRERPRNTLGFPKPLPKEEQAVDFLTLPSTHDHGRTNE